MWYFLGAIVVIALIAWVVRRTSLYRARSSGHTVKPGQWRGDPGFNAGAHSSLRPPHGDSRRPGRS
jgi:hypothetical protein